MFVEGFIGYLRISVFGLSEMGSFGRILSRGMICFELYFRKVILVFVLGIVF